jgi:hypothetical protein
MTMQGRPHGGRTVTAVCLLLLSTAPAKGQILSVISPSGQLKIGRRGSMADVTVTGASNESGSRDSLHVTTTPVAARAWIRSALAGLSGCEASQSSGPLTLLDQAAGPPDTDGGRFPRVFFHCGRAQRGAWAAIEIGDGEESDIRYQFSSYDQARHFLTECMNRLK